jgi:hypothetical protein
MPAKNLFLTQFFSAYYFLKVHLHHFSKIKSQKESQNIRNQCFSYYFCMMIEGSGSGSIPLTSGSGSWRPKNMGIRWIRIRNTENIFLKISFRGKKKTHFRLNSRRSSTLYSLDRVLFERECVILCVFSFIDWRFSASHTAGTLQLGH